MGANGMSGRLGSHYTHCPGSHENLCSSGLACPALIGMGPGGNNRRCRSVHFDRAPEDTQAHPTAFRRNRSCSPRPVWGSREGAATRNEIGTGHDRKVQRGPPLRVRLPFPATSKPSQPSKAPVPCAPSSPCVQTASALRPLLGPIITRSVGYRRPACPAIGPSPRRYTWWCRACSSAQHAEGAVGAGQHAQAKLLTWTSVLRVTPCSCRKQTSHVLAALIAHQLPTVDVVCFPF